MLIFRSCSLRACDFTKRWPNLHVILPTNGLTSQVIFSIFIKLFKGCVYYIFASLFFQSKGEHL